MKQLTRPERTHVTVHLSIDQWRHIDMLLTHEIRELQDTTRTTNHALYEKCIAFNHRIGDKIRKSFKAQGAELVK